MTETCKNTLKHMNWYNQPGSSFLIFIQISKIFRILNNEENMQPLELKHAKIVLSISILVRLFLQSIFYIFIIQFLEDQLLSTQMSNRCHKITLSLTGRLVISSISTPRTRIKQNYTITQFPLLFIGKRINPDSFSGN